MNDLQSLPTRLSPRVMELFDGLADLLNFPRPDLSSASGLEMPAGEFVASVYPLGPGSSILSLDIEIAVLSLEESDCQRLLALHRINDASRILTGWLVTLDENEILILSRRLRVEDTNPQDLAASLAEGLERAKELLEVWRALGAGKNPPGGPQKPDPSPTNSPGQ